MEIFNLINKYLTERSLEGEQRLFMEIKKHITKKKRQNKLPQYLFEFVDPDSEYIKKNETSHKLQKVTSEIDRLTGLAFTLFKQKKRWAKGTRTAFEHIVAYASEEQIKNPNLDLDKATLCFLFYQGKAPALITLLEEEFRTKSRTKTLLQCRDYVNKILKSSQDTNGSSPFKIIYTSTGKLRYGCKEWSVDKYKDKIIESAELEKIYIKNINENVSDNLDTSAIRINNYKTCIVKILEQANCPLTALQITTTLQRLMGMLVQEMSLQPIKDEVNEEIISAEENITTDNVPSPEEYLLTKEELIEKDKKYSDFINKLSRDEIKLLKIKFYEKPDGSLVTSDKSVSSYFNKCDESIRQLKIKIFNRIEQSFPQIEDGRNFIIHLAEFLKNYELKDDIP